ncbi:hypothetical protein Q7P37_005263 [Cladosporium fusiforme]
MLATKLSRAQLELQAHRVWLSRFSLRRTISKPFSTITSRQAKQARPTFKRVRSVGSPKVYDVQKMKKASEGSAQDQEDVLLVQQIREAANTDDFGTMAKAYRSISKKTNIQGWVLSTLTSRLSAWSRSQSEGRTTSADGETRDQVQSFALELEKDIREGTVPTLTAANTFLLLYFTHMQSWDAGMRFWKWLEAQEGEPYVNASVYGMAILMLEAQGAKLEDLEALYEQGLARFPADFSEYHFSPGAIVPDREMILHLPSLPVTLLLGIMKSRAMRGDSQNAYLALDSLLRLRPVALDQVFYSPFLKERPVAEAYTVFAMACKAGIVQVNSSYRALLSSLRQNADLSDARRYALTVKAMLSASYLHLGAGGRLGGNAVSELIIVLTGMLRIHGCSALPEAQREQLVDAVHELVRKVVAVCARFDTKPTIAAFNSIITNIAGLAKVEQIATEALKDAQVLGLRPTNVTRRSLLVAAGSGKDAALVAEAWKWLVEARAKEEQYPDATDLHILVRACVQANIGDLARKAIAEMTHLEEWQRENALERLDKEADLPSESEVPADVEAILAATADIKADLEVFDERTSDARGAQDFSSQTLPMLLFSPPKDVRLPEAEMRKLYDELTTDPNAVQPEFFRKESNRRPQSAHVTKMPFSQLRYESWKYITYLLAEAERHNEAYVNAVDSAIANGEKPPQRNYGELFEGDDKIKGVGLSDAPQELVVDGEEVDVEKARARIMELRKVSLPTKAETTEEGGILP